MHTHMLLLPLSQEMGLLSWFVVDLAINIGGWAVASILQVSHPVSAGGGRSCAVEGVNAKKY